jgi:lysine biosynthesis protein LysW
MDKAKCPVCHSDVLTADDAVLGDMVTCNNCGSDLEITSLHPMLLKEMSYGDDGLIDDEGDDSDDTEDDQ